MSLGKASKSNVQEVETRRKATAGMRRLTLVRRIALHRFIRRGGQGLACAQADSRAMPRADHLMVLDFAAG